MSVHHNREALLAEIQHMPEGRLFARNAPELVRFARKIRKTETCWFWIGKIDRTGYGRFKIKRGGVWKNYIAHKASYEYAKGSVPEGKELDHLCRNRSCVNPDHLEPVTAHENWRRGNQPGAIYCRTGLCKRGHAQTPENVVSYNGQRYCRTCRSAKSKEWKRRRRAYLSQQRRTTGPS